MSVQHRRNPELYADELAAAEKALMRTGIGMPQAVHDMMREQDRIYDARTAAGWECDEGGWYAPHPETGVLISYWDWMDFGLDDPEDAK